MAEVIEIVEAGYNRCGVGLIAAVVAGDGSYVVEKWRGPNVGCAIWIYRREKLREKVLNNAYG